MLKISRLADYGTVILSYLAKNVELSYSAATLSEKTGIATPTVSKILKLFNDAGLLISLRGANGGYKLARAPQQIKLTEVIAAVDGIPAMTECCKTHSQCEQHGDCALRGNWQLINKMVIQMLSNLSLADMSQPLTTPEVPVQFFN